MKHYVTIREAEVYELQPCVCGGFPDFVIPNDHYTDCWLMCRKCGRMTYNTGGYYHAHEIPLQEAKREAVELWNKGVFI